MHKNPRGFGHADFFVPLPPLLSEIRLMKHRVHTLFVPLAFVLGLVTCDRIDDPVEGIIETIDETYDIPALEPLDTDVQRVLIEDFRPPVWQLPQRQLGVECPERRPS